MAHTAKRTSRFERASHTSDVERVSQSSTCRAPEYDDGFNFPPTAHPGREIFTFSLLVLLMPNAVKHERDGVITAVVWGGWKLISLMLTWLI
jgi:hypothetical protein